MLLPTSQAYDLPIEVCIRCAFSLIRKDFSSVFKRASFKVFLATLLLTLPVK